MKQVTFTLSITEANLLFKALGRMPFTEVYELIGKMNQQANEQLAGDNSATPFSTANKANQNGDGH
jgi:hypothetical protein